MLRVLKGKFGTPIVTDYVILETSSLLAQRGIRRAIRPLSDFLTENKFRILFVTEDVYLEAMKLTNKDTGDFLSLTDSSQIVLSRFLGVDTMATFDGVLANFFQTSVGKGDFNRLDEKEKRLLLKGRQY